MTLQEALEAFLLEPRPAATQDSYGRILRLFVQDVGPKRDVTHIEPRDIDLWIRQQTEMKTKYESHSRRPVVNEPLSPATVYKRAKTVKVFFNWLVRREYLAQSPARFIKVRRPSQPLRTGKAATTHEVQELLGASKYKPRDYAIMMLLAQTGCRRSDIANLRIEDLNLEENRAVVDGKGNKRRIIYFDDATSAALRRWLDERPQTDHDFVFTGVRGGKPLAPTAVSQIVRRRASDARLRNLGPHSIRHNVGMTLARKHVPAPVIREILGHTSITVTMAYLASIDDDDIDDAARIISQMRGQTKNPTPADEEDDPS